MTEPCHGVLDENLTRFGSVLEEIVDAAIAISGADFGNIQLIDPKTSDLRIVAYRGFPQWWLDFWNSVSAGHGVCGTALASGHRVIVEDVEKSPIFIGTPALAIQLKAGVRAVQSTPIVARDGTPLGMFSTHYKTPQRPDERGLLLLDLLARQAADIIGRKQAEDQLRRLALHDTLTGLPNRLAFTAHLEQALERAKRHQKKVALLFLDLDRFKQVNDSLGHAKGDQLLQAIAARLQHSLRGEDMAARLGGDEFTVILEDITHAEDVANVAKKIITSVSEPIGLDDHELVTFTSIGISIFPNDADNAIDLAKAADAAMYRAKSRGRRTYEFYTPELTQFAMQRLAIEQGLRHALEQEQFELYYQPQIKVAGGQTCGVEALLRWHHPTMGMLLPRQFIGIAEDCGLIDDVGDWVLQRACAQAAQWHESGVRPMRIAINLSGHQIMCSRTSEKIQKRLQQSSLNLGQMQVQLEITETALLESGEKIFDVLKNLRELGISIAIDDFGTGYSSLSRLKQLPIDTLKIDRSFLSRIPEDADNLAIVSAILSMGHSLGLRVIAEGVETQSQLDFIRAQGGDEAQGFHIGRPLPAAEVASFLQRGAALAHAS